LGVCSFGNRAFVAAALVLAATLAAAGPPGPAARPPEPQLIAPGDVLVVHVWNDPRLGGPFAVEPDGAIAFPLVGRVHVAGRTEASAAEALSRRLADGFLKAPQVRVLISSPAPQFIYVLGEAARPGPVAARTDRPLAEVLATAGGLTLAASGKAVVLRPSAAENLVLHLDVRALLAGNPEHNVPLKPGDTVIFLAAESAKQRRVFVFGAAVRPGVVHLGEAGGLLDVVAECGGAAQDAEGVVRVIRGPDGSAKASQPVDVDMAALTTGRAGRDIQLADGDIVFFPRRAAREVYVLGEVIRPGPYAWRPDMTVFEAIMTAGGFTNKANREAITVSRVAGGAIQQVRARGDTPVQPGDVIKVSEGLL